MIQEKSDQKNGPPGPIDPKAQNLNEDYLEKYSKLLDKLERELIIRSQLSSDSNILITET